VGYILFMLHRCSMLLYCGPFMRIMTHWNCCSTMGLLARSSLRGSLQYVFHLRNIAAYSSLPGLSHSQVFRFLCPLLEPLSVCALVTVCAIGALSSVLSCTSEALYSSTQFSEERQMLANFEVAERLWSFDARFRGAWAEIFMRSTNEALAIPVLEQYLASDPNNIGLRVVLALHQFHVGNTPAFTAIMHDLAVRAPHTPLVVKWRSLGGQ